MSPDALLAVESEIGEDSVVLPCGWAHASVLELAGADGLVVDGDWVETKDQDPNGDVRLIQLADIGEGFFQDRSSRYLTDDTADRLRCTFLSKGDVLIARMAAPLGRACIFPSLRQRAVTAVDVCIWRPGSGSAIDPRWLMHILNSPQARALFLAGASGTTRQRISGTKLKQLRLPVPPAPEQRRIVARIDELLVEIDEGEAALDRTRQGLDTWHRALLRAAVTGELTRDWREANRPAETGADLLARIHVETRIPTTGSRTSRSSAAPASLDSKSLPELPEAWAWAPVGDIIESLRNGTATVPVKRQTECPILRISAVRPLAVDASDIRYLDENSAHGLEEFRTQSGDLLFTRYNGSRHLVGVCGIFRGEKPVYYPDKIIRVCLVPQLREISSFFEAAINSGTIRKFIDGEIKTTAGQHGISGASIKRVPIPIPPITEAKRIVELLRDDLSRAEDMEALQAVHLKSAAALRQSILKAAFEGRLVSQDPTDEAASVLLARLRESCPQKGIRRRARVTEDFSHPSLPGLTRRSEDPPVLPAGDE